MQDGHGMVTVEAVEAVEAVIARRHENDGAEWRPTSRGGEV